MSGEADTRVEARKAGKREVNRISKTFQDERDVRRVVVVSVKSTGIRVGSSYLYLKPYRNTVSSTLRVYDGAVK
jgi:hypothetical protein